jgi:hypothetical protein
VKSYNLAKLREYKHWQLGLLFGNVETKNHLDVGTAKRRKEYYKGEGGGFPRVWAVVSLMNPRSPVICPSTKSVLNNVLINLLVGLMHIRASN